MRGVLILHGFTGTPFEVSYLADKLAGSGLVVQTPLLPGHGTSPLQLNRTTADQWRGAVADHLADLRSRTNAPVAVVGQSMGGLLALDAASQQAGIAAVVSLATPLRLAGVGRAMSALGLLPRRLTQNWPSIAKSGGGSDVRDLEIKAQNPSYPVLPLSGVVELTRLMRSVRRRLARIHCPLLAVHGRCDHTAPPDSASEILASVASADRQLLVVPNSYHLVAHDVERDRVAGAVGRFLARVLV